MKFIQIVMTILVLGLPPMNASSQHHGQSSKENSKQSSEAAPYAGLQTRRIKSLSARDVEQIKQGHGWGLALPAELNGLPGPKHLLELKEALRLSATQVDQITDLYTAMKKDAVAAGERFIAAEAALSQAFESKNLDKNELRELLRESASARAELRYVHLSRHIETTDFLTSDQIKRYSALRGYTDDPCNMIPDGHNPEMWRKHNGCL